MPTSTEHNVHLTEDEGFQEEAESNAGLSKPQTMRKQQREISHQTEEEKGDCVYQGLKKECFAAFICKFMFWVKRLKI